ncbi:MAG: Trk system potassium transporter TrkA [Bacteroides sp.]|nr:Trk system potassium transporter TrkA [Lachnospiraceae bacterium]MCM1332367.1 Trk system potassium transporter TrkA [Bacteroides sp.]MCM1389669.1 Trk system potassium transporter TrkA [Bacteroides sp.]
MRIVIAGAGEVGSHLAKLLSREEQDIVVIDPDNHRLANLDANYNLMTLKGNPISFKDLRKAGVEKCDLFIAVTPEETQNILACSIARNIGAQRTVARIDNFEFMSDEHQEYFTRMGVNALIYPELLAAQEIYTALHRTWVRQWFELHDGEIIILGVKLRDNAQIIGMQLKEFAQIKHNFHVAAIKRRHETIIPRGDDVIKESDILYFATRKDHVDELIELCGKKTRRIKKLIIMGGSRIAIRLAALAGNEYDIKIIDNDIDTCRSLPERCPDCDIIHGDARDIDVLREEGIADTDAFIALSSSSETNILACLTAKEFGVAKSIAEVEDLQFISEAEGLNIGTIINKKLLASSKIFQLLLDADSTTSKCLALADAEVAEIEAKPGSKITRSAVKNLSLPRGMTIAALIRDGKGMLVSGNTEVQPGDHVVVFCLSGSIHKVEKLFN